MDVSPTLPLKIHCLRSFIHLFYTKLSFLFTAALIFVSGGIHIAWSIGFDSLFAELEVTNHVRICWFTAAIIGALLGGFFSRKFSYKFLMVRTCPGRQYTDRPY